MSSGEEGGGEDGPHTNAFQAKLDQKKKRAKFGYREQSFRGRGGGFRGYARICMYGCCVSTLVVTVTDVRNFSTCFVRDSLFTSVLCFYSYNFAPRPHACQWRTKVFFRTGGVGEGEC